MGREALMGPYEPWGPLETLRGSAWLLLSLPGAYSPGSSWLLLAPSGSSIFKRNMVIIKPLNSFLLQAYSW